METEKPVRRKYKKLIPVVLVIAVLGLIILGFVLKPTFSHTGPATQIDAATQDLPVTLTLAQAEISITSRGFTPQTVTIKKGQAVSWINNSFIKHQIVSDAPSADSKLPSFKGQGPLLRTDMFLFTFKTTGTFAYHDELNPTLTGTIIVQ